MAGVFSVVAGVVVSDGEHSQFFRFVSIRGFQKVAVESDGQWGRRGRRITFTANFMVSTRREGAHWHRRLNPGMMSVQDGIRPLPRMRD